MEKNFLTIIFIFFSTISYSKNMILDDLSNPGQTSQNQKWSFITDKVMGGLSVGKVIIDKIENKICYRMTGNVTTKNNGGFIQIRALVLPNVNINQFEGVYFKVIGNNKNYNLHVRTGATLAPWQYYSFSFFSKSKWVEIRAPFKKFKKSNFYQPKKLFHQKMKSIALVAGFDDFESDICLSEIGLY